MLYLVLYDNVTAVCIFIRYWLWSISEIKVVAYGFYIIHNFTFGKCLRKKCLRKHSFSPWDLCSSNSPSRLVFIIFLFVIYLLKVVAIATTCLKYRAFLYFHGFFCPISQVSFGVNLLKFAKKKFEDINSTILISFFLKIQYCKCFLMLKNYIY